MFDEMYVQAKHDEHILAFGLWTVLMERQGSIEQLQDAGSAGRWKSLQICSEPGSAEPPVLVLRFCHCLRAKLQKATA